MDVLLEWSSAPRSTSLPLKGGGKGPYEARPTRCIPKRSNSWDRFVKRRRGLPEIAATLHGDVRLSEPLRQAAFRVFLCRALMRRATDGSGAAQLPVRASPSGTRLENSPAIRQSAVFHSISHIVPK